MKKCFCSAIATYLVAMATAVAVCPAMPALARESGDVALTVEPVVVTEAVDAPTQDNDELLAGYIDQRFAEQLPTEDDGEPELFAQSVGETLTGNTAIAYEYVKAEIAKIAAGERASTEITVPLSLITDKTQFSAADLGLSYIYDSDWNPDIPDALDTYIDIDFTAIVGALLSDCPYEMYWFDKTTGYSHAAYRGYGATYNYQTGEYELTLGEEYWPYVSFKVAQAYAAGTYELDTSKIDRVSTAVDNAAQIVADNASKSAFGKMTAYKETICDWVDYNDDAAENNDTPYGDPWQLVYVFDGDESTNVVCEGYAKAFKYLCDLGHLHGIECLLVTGKLGKGTGAGDHMWNIVKMYDGKSYLVDVTNCDTGSIGAPDKLFFKAPTSGSAATGYEFIFDSLNSTGYAYDDGSDGRSRSMWDYYTDAELTLADTDFVEGAVPEPTADDISGATVTADDATYTGTAHTPTAKVVLHGKTLTEGTDYTVAYADNENAGTATITVTGRGDYEGTATGTFTINPKAATPELGISSANFTYTGSVQQPQVTRVMADGVTLGETDYEVTYADGCVAVGTYTVTVTLTGNYTGSASMDFVIDPASLKGATVTAAAESYVYDGSAKKPAVTVKLNGTTLAADDYDVAYANNTSVGTAKITVTGKGNYTGFATGTFAITARDLSDAEVSLDQDSFTYDGSAQKPAVTVTLDGQELTKDNDFTVDYANNTNAGTATVTITGTGNYTGVAEKSFAIARAAQELTVQDVNVLVGAAATLDVQVLDNAELTYEVQDDAIATVSDEGVVTGVAAGSTSVKVTAAATDNYEAAEATVAVTVSQESLDDAQVALDQDHFTYDGTAHEPAAIVELKNETLVPDVDYTVSYKDNIDAGTATATITGKGAYAGKRTVNFEINRAEKAIVIVNDEVLGMAYGEHATLEIEAEGTLTFASSDTDVVTVDDAGTLEATGLGQVELTITAAGTRNYLPSDLHATVRVSEADLSDASVRVDDQTLTYTGEAQEPAVTVSLNEKELVSGTDYTVAYDANVDAGTATVIVTGEGNYTGTAYASFDINPAEVSTAQASIPGQTYTGEPLEPAPTLVFAGKELKEGEDYSYSSSDYENNTEIGKEAQLTVYGEGNFTGSVVLTFEISEKPKIDISGATVEIPSQEFAEADLTPEVHVVLGDDELVAGTDYELSYGDLYHAGEYPVTITGTGDYTGTTAGTFVITRKQVNCTVSFSPDTFVYDGKPHQPSPETSSLFSVRKGSKVANSGEYELDYSGDGVNAGTYTVTATLTGDYEGSASKTYTVTARDLRTVDIALAETSYTYDGEAHEPAVVAKRDAKELKEGVDYSVDYADNTNAGTATATITGKGNYAGEVERTFTIRPLEANPEVTLSQIELVYTGEAQHPEVTSVIVKGKKLDSTDYEVSYSDGCIEVGSYDVLVTLKGNYTGEATATFAIVEAPKPQDLSSASIALAEASYTYDGTAHEPAVTVTLDGQELTEGTDYTVAYADNTNAGTATVTVTGVGAYEGTATATFDIAKATPAITAADKSIVATTTANLATQVTDGAGALSFQTSDARVATVTAAGVVRGVASGRATITIACAESENFEAASKTVTVTVSKAANTMTAKAKKAKVTVKAKKVAKKKAALKSNVVVSQAQGVVTYTNVSKKAVAKKIKVNAKTGKITVAKRTKKGTYKVRVKVTVAGNATYAAATKTVTFKVVVK